MFRLLIKFCRGYPDDANAVHTYMFGSDQMCLGHKFNPLNITNQYIYICMFSRSCNLGSL